MTGRVCARCRRWQRSGNAGWCARFLTVTGAGDTCNHWEGET